MRPVDPRGALSSLVHYVVRLPTGKLILWCYLIWYLGVVARYFDPSPAIWLNSLGVSAVIGFALMLSVSAGRSATADPWQTFRLFLMPFCVSSFSSLIKGRGFILVVPPHAAEAAMLVAGCAAFVIAVLSMKRAARAQRA